MEQGLNELMQFLKGDEPVTIDEQQKKTPSVALSRSRIRPITARGGTIGRSTTAIANTQLEVTDDTDMNSLRTNPRVLAEYSTVEHPLIPGSFVFLRRSGDIRGRTHPRLTLLERSIIERHNALQISQRPVRLSVLIPIPIVNRQSENDEELNSRLLSMFNDDDDVSDLYE